ncbi:hypothetical protein KFK09_007482 [Dendrobium nobile]|uniref:Uncharacterized protein n=1 Tax=Dendrobium nobile TaxID=94219 RepID=A0A8T3BWN2_DENNO|nr:hypothetical protein KFK09_007482 [Dendrobium nobile]
MVGFFIISVSSIYVTSLMFLLTGIYLFRIPLFLNAWPSPPPSPSSPPVAFA